MRGYLVLIVASILLPVLVFAGILFTRYYFSELSRIEEYLKNDARGLALTVDRDLQGQQFTLEALSTSQFIANRDYEGFYQQALKISKFTGVNILLRDLTGRQLANTRVPWATPLPRDAVEGDDEVLKTKRPFITGLIIGTVARRPLYTITVPVLDGDRVTAFLHLSLELPRLAELLDENIEPPRTAGIFDRNYMLMARTRGFDRLAGKRAPQGFMEQATASEGLWRGIDDEGNRVRAGLARSKLAGWWIWVSIPEAAVQSSLRNTLWTLAALGAALILLALLIAYLFGGRLARSIGTLAMQADSLGRGESVSMDELPVREVHEVGEQLAAASAKLRQREGERDRAEQELRRLSETLEKKVSERTRELVDEIQRRIETEAVLRQAQKMDAIGQLTGGIAHDFNNMLAVITGSLGVALRHLARGDGGVDRLLANALEGARRAAALIQRLLAFARQQPLQPEPIEANKLVAGMSELLGRSLGETVQLETVLAAGLWRVHADPNQLESAILNLAVNARDAMPDRGKVTIETANSYLDEAYVARQAGVPAGQYVLIAVTDIGIGMTPDVIEKAFDPFFTTKKPGSGTGLGLSQVYGFVKQSGGHIKIYSEPGQGTTVKIYLPRYFGEAASRPAAADTTPLPMNDGSVTVLAVEDEEAVRVQAVDALQELGYKVLSAATATAALEMIDAHPEIGLLFTDVVMPDMNGQRLCEEAVRRRPSLKVLFTTGYTRNAIVHNGMLDPGVHLLGKPFTLEQLARKIAEVLKG